MDMSLFVFLSLHFFLSFFSFVSAYMNICFHMNLAMILLSCRFSSEMDTFDNDCWFLFLLF